MSEAIIQIRNLSVTLKIIPNPFEIMARNLQLEDISTVSEEDLLGRRPIKPDESKIATFLAKKKITYLYAIPTFLFPQLPHSSFFLLQEKSWTLNPWGMNRILWWGFNKF